MTKVITYGSFDMLHRGHLRLLERAKALGDYLIVGVTSDDYDKTRGKINLQQSLMERIEAVKETGIPDEVVIEEYEGQKIDDIQRFEVDIFTVGSDWEGYFDYLNDYCKVIYLSRTEGISSSEIRSQDTALTVGLYGSALYLEKVLDEASFVNGLSVVGVYTDNIDYLSDKLKRLPIVTSAREKLLDHVDAVYIHSYPEAHYLQVKEALEHGKHVLCESPITMDIKQLSELYDIASQRGLVLMEAIKTAYATAYQRMLLLIKAGKIGRVFSIKSTCTSQKAIIQKENDVFDKQWGSLYTWGPTGLLPVFQILGCDFCDRKIITHIEDLTSLNKYDAYTKIDFIYPSAAATVEVGRGIKSEGELVVSGSDGYIYVPAPWWKTDYFELRYENPAFNKKFFYQLEGEGIRYELLSFSRGIKSQTKVFNIEESVTLGIAGIMGNYKDGIEINYI